ncbi:MAG: DUF3267 domain-containing protein [Clostridia bacterium]|nr:DUF3267 domain-containing protein [Clostridia bacterium]
MKAYSELPEGYKEILSIDLQKDKKLSAKIHILALIIAVLTVVPMQFFVPATELFSMEDSGLYFIRFVSIFVLIIVYMVLHEAVHGIAMKICGTKKVKYGFTGSYAYAGSTDFYDKSAYIFIALAPVVLWGIVLAAVCFFVPREWFWVVYFIEVNNLSGAAGDLYVTLRFSKLPEDILVRDHGVGMAVFSREEDAR